jgi:hypothetical protein
MRWWLGWADLGERIWIWLLWGEQLGTSVNPICPAEQWVFFLTLLRAPSEEKQKV